MSVLENRVEKTEQVVFDATEHLRAFCTSKFGSSFDIGHLQVEESKEYYIQAEKEGLQAVEKNKNMSIVVSLSLSPLSPSLACVWCVFARAFLPLSVVFFPPGSPTLPHSSRPCSFLLVLFPMFCLSIMSPPLHSQRAC